MDKKREGLPMPISDADEEYRLDAYFTAREKEAALKALKDRKTPELRSMEHRLKESVEFVQREIDKVFSTETDLRTIKKKVKELVKIFEHIT